MAVKPADKKSDGEQPSNPPGLTPQQQLAMMMFLARGGSFQLLALSSRINASQAQQSEPPQESVAPEGATNPFSSMFRGP